MRVLFVCPSTVSSGEAITAQHMARDVVASGGEVRFLASGLTAGFVADPFADRVTTLGADLAANRGLWDTTVREFAPEVVAFADYPLLNFPNGSVPLADDDWVRSLESLDAALVTLDHLGYAQRPMTVYFGPPHLSLASATTPALPPGMRVALPCPVQEPGPVDGREGLPFRYWEPPDSSSEDEVRRTRRRYVDDGESLVVHSVPGWAWRAADLWGLPYYPFLSRLLADYLAGLPRPVTVVSVNDGRLLAPSGTDDVRILNLAALPPDAFERLLLAADLVLTENSISVGLGKAVCALRPAAVLRNSHRLVDLLVDADPAVRTTILAMESARLGAIFPYEVFPTWGRTDLDQLGIHRDNRFVAGFAWLEAFGGEVTRSTLHRLLLDRGLRDELSARQAVYARAVGALPGPSDLLRGLR